jgi:hypothetical protein
MDYYKLPKDKRWLRDGDSPYSIGGRDTDISEIGHSLEQTLWTLYPSDPIPKHLASALYVLQEDLDAAQRSLEAFISLVSDAMA